MVFVGCTPYHNTKVSIDLENDLSRELVVEGSINKSNTEETLENVQNVITGIIKKVDKYEGTLSSSIESDKL